MEVRTLRSRRGLLGGVSTIAAGVLIGGAAWACVPQAGLSASSTSGAPGSVITVTGRTFDSGGSGVNLWWDGVNKVSLGTASVDANRGFTASVTIPSDAQAKTYIIFATQNDANGVGVPGSPARAIYRVTDAPAPVAAAANPQTEPQQAQGAAGLAVAPTETPAPAPAAAPRPAATTARQPAPAVRTPARTVTPAPAAVTPAPAAEATPAPATPAPVAPAVEATPAPANPVPAPAVATEAPTTARRSVMVSMAGDSDSSPWLAIGLVGVGLVLSLGATALVIAGRRDRKSPAAARR